MDIQFYGAHTFEITINKTSFIIDPAKPSIHDKTPNLKKSVVLLTNNFETQPVASKDAEFVIDSAGEYEIHGVALNGVQTPAMLDVHDEGELVMNFAYSLRANDISLGVVGHPKTPLDEGILEQLGTLDVLIVPVGGGGLTLDPEAATRLVKAVDPKIVIPAHYEQTGVTYETPQAKLEDFTTELGIPSMKEEKLKLKSSTLPESMELYQLG